MPDLKQRLVVLRSLLTVDVVLRLAAVLLAAVVFVRVLFGGSAGLWSILLVVGAALTLWGALRLYTLARRSLTQSGPDVPDWLASSRILAAVATRPRSRLAATFGLLILIVHAGITGYVGIWTILVALTIATIATLLSPNLRLAALLGLLAVVFAAATVFVASLFRGSIEARALAVSLAAVVVPVLVSDKLVGLVRLPALTTTHHAILAVLTLTLAFLGWSREDWLPGVASSCYTLPTSSGITVLRATADGDRCYGLIDTADAGVFARPAFSRDPVTIKLQNEILRNNRKLDDGDLTVIWLGALSCDPAPGDATRCADGRDYPSERDQLRALLLAQSSIAGSTDHELHVVLADATQDVQHADDIAELIVDRQAVLGDRVVVIGGGDSRDTTQSAINKLLDAGIPFIAPNLLADLGAPGRPFVDRAGYFQLASPNRVYAKDTVDWIEATYPGGYRLDVYQHPNPTDHYTTSLVNDLLAAVPDRKGTSARRVTGLDRIDESVCDGATGGPPTALVFADRWTRFADFVQRLNDLCGHTKPRMVIADVSVGRFMADYRLRAVTTADWPIDYYVGGPGCGALTETSYATIKQQLHRPRYRDLLKIPKGTDFACADRTGGTDRVCTLDAAAKLTSQQCRPNDLGTYLIPAWDSVRLADALLPERRSPGRNYLTTLQLPTTTLSTGAQVTVSNGVLRDPTIPVELWHVDAVNDPASKPRLLVPKEPAAVER